MDKATKRRAVELVKEYPKNKLLIRARRMELLHPYNEDKDENIGGGHLQGGKKDGNENRVIRLVDDKVQLHLQNRGLAVEFAFKQNDETTNAIIKRHLMTKYPDKVSKLCLDLHVGKTQFYERENYFLAMAIDLFDALERNGKYSEQTANR